MVGEGGKTLNTRDLNPGVIAAALVVVVAIIGFFIWRGTAVHPYTGPPINMGAAMAGGHKGAAPGGAGR
jgi:hypothetical protein